MKGEDIYNGITEIREDLVEEAGSAAKKRRPMKKRALGAVAAVLASPDEGAALGAAARNRALSTHDPAANAAQLQAIYRAILIEEARRP